MRGDSHSGARKWNRIALAVAVGLFLTGVLGGGGVWARHTDLQWRQINDIYIGFRRDVDCVSTYTGPPGIPTDPAHHRHCRTFYQVGSLQLSVRRH